MMKNLINLTNSRDLEWACSRRHRYYWTKDLDGNSVSLYEKKLVTYDEDGMVIIEGGFRLWQLGKIVKKQVGEIKL